jgi:hypothetical protein
MWRSRISKLLKFSRFMVHTSTYWYIQVCVLVQTETKQHTLLDHALSALLRLRVSAERLAWSLCTGSLRTAVSFTVRPPRRGLPWHSQVLTSYTLLPRLPSGDAESAQPMGNPEAWCLLNLCGIVGVESPARNKGMRGTLPTMWSTGAT